MNPEIFKLIGVCAICVTITAALILWLISHCNLVALKSEIQEDLTNLYSPEILGAVPAKKKENASEETKPDADDSKTNQ